LVVHEIAFKFQRSSPIHTASLELPEVTFATWCNRDRDVIEIASDSDEPEAFQELQDSVQILKQKLGIEIFRKTTSGGSVQIVTQCNCSTKRQSTPSIIEKHNLLQMQPTFYKRGWGWYRALAFRQSDVTSLFRELEKFGAVHTVYRKPASGTPIRDTFVISAKSLLGGLTKKQAVALLTAISLGYYDIPKSTSTEELARSLGLPRTTFEEHLRKGESKALKAMMPLLRFSGPERPRQESTAKKGFEKLAIPQIQSA
jgi:predicted DNA binding protein